MPSKRQAKPFYAVARGHCPGIYTSWDETKEQVEWFPNARHRSFATAMEAAAFIKEHCTPGFPIESLVADRSDSAASGLGLPQQPVRKTLSPPNRSHCNGTARTDDPVARQGFIEQPAIVAQDSLRYKFYGGIPIESFHSATGLGLLQQPVKITLNPSNRSHYDEATRSDDTAARQGAPEQDPRHYKFYGVAKGKFPGVYRSWKEAELQKESMWSARCKGFSNYEDAQQYVDDFRKLHEIYPSDPDPRDPSTLVAFTDGSAMKNGTPFCRAAWACVFPHNPDWHRAAPLPGCWQTNNRAEYRAAIEALVRANVEDPAKVKPLYIFSDSNLLISSMTEWIGDWKARGWVKADGEKVKNVDLLEWLLKEQGERRVIWRHVKAHTNKRDWKSIWNDTADQMAKELSRNDFNPNVGDPPQKAQRESARGGGSVYKRGRPTTGTEFERGAGYKYKRGRG